MNTQQLRYVIAVAEDGSMSRAAERLFVSQTSLSTTAKALEREAGVRLFRRSNSGAELTDRSSAELRRVSRLDGRA